jgi:hypothetical protein
MRYADIIFLNIHYAIAHFPTHASTPRSFLLSLAASPAVSSHALLVAYWGNKQGAAVLSLPTKEYFQSSSWVPPPVNQPKHMSIIDGDTSVGFESVKSGSGFWANGGDRSTSSEFSLNRMSGATATDEQVEDDDDDSDGTETGREEPEEDVIDEVGAQDAFVAGMIYALSRRMVPGHPYTPSNSTTAAAANANGSDRDKGRWRLEECLK